ncbi:MAG: flagellar export chaperone FliS [Oscillospiraceae bacterium]|jgi:flagellar protein FliS|nr:flagellar export chaperone FliS [Oscillospiraceae bacterium]
MQQTVMINTRAHDAYRRQDVLTASPIELIIMLYDALKKNIVLGKRGIEKNDIQQAHKSLIKAQMILTELINSLDMSYQISQELMDLYDFALRSIADANMHKDTEPLEPVVEMVESIREAWKEVSIANKGTLQLGEELA